MDEDLLKRNTDCVYFLASPLTCKKGAECEYRHNEVARLNPRDCWYWLSGNCLNPTCAFRHPPLDGHTGGGPSEPTKSSLPTNKTMVPCYFFYNGFCNKGDRCSFLHGPDDSFFTGKPVKNDNGSANTISLENKTLSEKKTAVASKPSETHFDQSLTISKASPDCKLQPKEDAPLPENVKQQGDCLELSASFDGKEASVTGSESDSLLPDDGFVHKASDLHTEQSSEEQVSSHIEPEERWESSPGFDVLVHDESEILGYEDASEYLPVLDMDGQELNEQYSGYEFKDPVEYDTMFPEDDILYEQGTNNGYRCFDRDFMYANGGKTHPYSREVILDSILTRKRLRISDEMAACDKNLDLRDHLRGQREINGSPGSGFLSRHESSLMFQNQERHQRRSIHQRLSRRLTSQLGFSTIDSTGPAEHGIFRHSQQHRPRKQHHREKPAKQQFVSSKISRKPPASKRRRFIEEATAFSGPKSLAEIKQEKMKKAEGSLHRESTSAGFQDPKPLSEILKDKTTTD